MLLLICTLFVVLLIVVALSIHAREISRYSHIPGVSQVLPMSIVRIPVLAPYLYLNNLKSASELRKRFGHNGIFRITAFNRTYIVTSSLEATRHVLVKNYSNYPKPYAAYRAINVYGMNIVSASGGEMHRKHRRVVESAFDEKHLRYMVEVTNKSTDLLIDRLVNNGSKIEVNSDMVDVTMDIIGKSAFGYDLNIFSDTPNAKHTQFDKTKHSMSFYDALEITNTSGIIMTNFVPQWLRFLPMFSKTKRAIAETRSYIQELVESRKGHDGHLDLLSLLVQANENPHSEAKLTTEEVISDAFIMLVAGHETSATLFGWILYEVTKHKEVQRKLQEEIDRVLGTRDPTYDDIENLKYTNNVIKESLRIHSPVRAIPKTNLKKDTICGYTIPRNSFVTVNFRNIHHSDEYWADANSFRPERFDEKYDPLTFLSFAYGSRKCIGFNFSLIETAVILAKFLQKFNVEFEDHIDPKVFEPKVSGIITVKVDKLYLQLKPRSAFHQ